MIQYFPVKNYTMKCRLYPNKRQAAQIDRILNVERICGNKFLYKMRNCGEFVREASDKKEEGKKVHFPDFRSIKKADNYKKLIEEDKRISIIPKGSLSGKSNSIFDAMQSAFDKTGKHPIEQWGIKYIDKDGKEKKIRGVDYFRHGKPNSFFYQGSGIYLIPTKDTDDEGNIIYKQNVFLLQVANIKSGKQKDDDYISGKVKVRGWNKNIRFDEEYKQDFLEWSQINKKQLSIRVVKDNCGDYFVTFTLPLVYKPMYVNERRDAVGVDVGEKAIATLDNGEKFPNIFDAYSKMSRLKDTDKHYDRKLSRSQGWKNIKFRDAHKEDNKLVPSETYKAYDLKKKRINRKIVRIRKDYYHKVAAKIATSADIVGVETLSVRDMFERKD